MKEIDINNLQINPFSKIGTEWMLITSTNGKQINSMTASWGGLGVLWNKNIAFIFIRPERYTKKFIDSSNEFSLNFFDEKYKKTLTYFGTVSGRTEDKISNSNLHTTFINNIPSFEESSLVINCKNLYKQELNPDCFIDKSLDSLHYPGKNYHMLYIAEIVGAYSSHSSDS